MQPGNPYHLIEAVGSCQVGSVWSAIDPQGRSLMVALLDSNVATDQRWREAFAAAANTLVQAGEPGYLYADFSAPSPWVAYSAENGVGAERVFLALGMDYQPVPPDGLGPVDHHTPFEQAPATPDPASAQSQPLPPDVIETTTPLAVENPPVLPVTPTVTPPVTPSAAPDEDATTAIPAAGDVETTQPTAPMELPPTAVNPWAAGPPQSVSPSPQQAAPVSPPPQQVSPQQVSPSPPLPVISGPPHPVSGAPRPVSGTPVSSTPVSGTPVSGTPISGTPISGTPMSPAFGPVPMSPAYGPPAPAYGPRPPQGPAPYDPYAPVGSPQKRSRTGLWIGIGMVVLLLIAGGGGVYAWSASGGDPNPPSPTTATTAPSAAFPTAPPVSPGVEPPTAGKWPANWPRYTERDDVRTLSNLDGLGFTLKVPRGWDCVLAGRAEGFAKYNCGAHPGEATEIGGELIVRDCTQPCDEQRQTTMRQAEEAWGIHWIRSGQFSTLGETILDVDGVQRHALVVVAYWRGGSDGLVDRQLVFRMTAPVREAQQLRRIATYIRDTVVF